MRYRLMQAAAAAASAIAIVVPTAAFAAQAKYTTTCFIQSRGFPPRGQQHCVVSESAGKSLTEIRVKLKSGPTYVERIAIGPDGARKSSLQNLRSGFGAKLAGEFTCAGLEASADQICFDIGKADIIGWPG